MWCVPEATEVAPIVQEQTDAAGAAAAAAAIDAALTTDEGAPMPAAAVVVEAPRGQVGLCWRVHTGHSPCATSSALPDMLLHSALLHHSLVPQNPMGPI
jgi:hypothetical protein